MTAPDIAALRAAYEEAVEEHGVLWQKLQDQRVKTLACREALLKAEIAPLVDSGWRVEVDREGHCLLTLPVRFSPYRVYIEARTLEGYLWGVSPYGTGPYGRAAESLGAAAHEALVWAAAEQAWREEERQLPMDLQVERALHRLLGKGWGRPSLTLKLWRKTLGSEMGADPGLSAVKKVLQQCVESGHLERNKYREYGTPLPAR